MSLKEKAKAFVPYGFEVISYAALAIPLTLATDVKTTADVLGSMYLFSSPLRYFFKDADFEFKTDSKVTKAIYSPII